MKNIAGVFVSILLTGVTAHADTPAVHGMVIFSGEKTTYASHLPMFHSPHDRQVILKITFRELAGSHILEEYRNAKNSGKKLFTIEPQVMDLEQVANGTKTEFVGSLYDGHFERGGSNLGNVKVQVEKVVYSTRISSQTQPHLEKNYFIFGEKGEYFAAHIIHGKPSFDAILEVSQPYTIYQPVFRTRNCFKRRETIPDGQLPLTLAGTENPQNLQNEPHQKLGDPSTVNADVRNVVYFEEADLSD